ncbi:MAG: TIGR01212 family radical SAM protein [Acidaminobacteraceae bacterium]
MRWNDKRYNNINYNLKEKFGSKVIKLSIDGGFTCPNRDGKVAKNGCIFCSEMGSGDFAGCKDRSGSIHDQMNHQILLLKEKWPEAKYIAYFQNFTNTYDTVDNLRIVFEQALSFDHVVGLAIATRSDCLGDDVLDLLDELNKKTYLWLEIGLQSYSDKTNNLIRRGYDNSVLEDSLKKLANLNIETVLHLIAGLPYESDEDFIKSIRYVNKLNPSGVKIHLLHILKNTELYNMYIEKPFHIYEYEEYLNLICKAIEILDPSIVIHRLTGDGPKDLLFEPRWTLDKRRTLNGITKELNIRNTYQGIYIQ